MQFHHGLGVAVLEGQFRQGAALGLELFVSAHDGEDGLINSGEILEMSLRKEGKSRHLVEEKSEYQGFYESFLWKVFDEQVEAVAEVEEGLLGVVFGQSAAADVINHRSGVHFDFVTDVLDAPAEVDFLHVGEEVVVEAAHVVIDVAAHEHRRAGSPENILHGVVLSVVFFHVAEHAPATERIAVFVDVAAACACVFELVAAMEGEEFGLHGGNFLVGVHLLNDGFDPAVGNFDVGVEQTVVFRLNALQGKVIAFGEAFVPVVEQQSHLREMLLHERHGIVRGGVVAHHRFGIIWQRFQQTRQKTLQKSSSVPVQNHDRKFHHNINISKFFIERQK